ncbi:MAG: type II secretion system F family protein [Armatimonadetes bacterium]|nr:type II secretion system F family protein [Armatimonadota bacterium]
MPLYQYQARDKVGKAIRGLVDAASSAAAYEKLRARGHFPTRVELDVGGGSRTAGGESLAYSLMQFASLLRSGIPMDEALQSLSEYDENPKLRHALRRVQVRLREGETLTGAMADEDAFPPMLIRMVEAGEESGRPADILGRYAEYLKRDLEHRRALTGALTYPVVLLVLSVVLLTGLLYFLTPVLKEMYGALDVELPTVTLIIITVGELIGSWAMLVLILLGAAGLGFLRMIPEVVVDRWRLSVPLLGALLKCGLMERWARTLAMLQETGVPLVRAMQLSRESLDNRALATELQTAEKSVERGEGLAAALGRAYLVPPLLHQFLRTGERSGELVMMLNSAATFYERELERRRSILVRFMEPAMILMMGIVVGFMVLSVLLPLADISSQML